MSNKDIESRKYMRDNTHFADVFNYLLYDGEQVIDPEELRPFESAELAIPYGNEVRQPRQKLRDVLKLWQQKTDGKAIYTVLGGEIQDQVHYAMPVRNGLYDFMDYADQVERARKSYRKQVQKEGAGKMTGAEYLSGFRKEDRLMPVITLVIFLGASEWDAPMSIHEMLSIGDEHLLKYVPDYRIHLIAPSQMRDADFLKFRTGFGQVLQYIKYSRNKEKLYQIIHESDRFREMDEDSANLLNAVTGSGLKWESKGGKVDMCTAIEEMRRESMEQGMEKGIAEGREKAIVTAVRNVMKNMGMTAEQAMKMMGVPDSEQIKYKTLL